MPPTIMKLAASPPFLSLADIPTQVSVSYLSSTTSKPACVVPSASHSPMISERGLSRPASVEDGEERVGLRALQGDENQALSHSLPAAWRANPHGKTSVPARSYSDLTRRDDSSTTTIIVVVVIAALLILGFATFFICCADNTMRRWQKSKGYPGNVGLVRRPGDIEIPRRRIPVQRQAVLMLSLPTMRMREPEKMVLRLPRE